MDCQGPLSLGFSLQEYWDGLQCHPPEDLAKPEIEATSSVSPALQADYLPAEPQEKPQNTGVGSLSLLHQIFLTQELNQGLLDCSCILYQLSYGGSPTNQNGHHQNICK